MKRIHWPVLGLVGILGLALNVFTGDFDKEFSEAQKLAASGKIDEAVQKYREIESFAAGTNEAVLAAKAIGDTYRASKPEEAIKAYQRCIETYPTSYLAGQAWLSLGQAYLVMKDVKKAEETLAGMAQAKIDPGYVNWLKFGYGANLGNAYLQMPEEESRKKGAQYVVESISSRPISTAIQPFIYFVFGYDMDKLAPLQWRTALKSLIQDYQSLPGYEKNVEMTFGLNNARYALAAVYLKDERTRPEAADMLLSVLGAANHPYYHVVMVHMTINREKLESLFEKDAASRDKWVKSMESAIAYMKGYIEKSPSERPSYQPTLDALQTTLERLQPRKP